MDVRGRIFFLLGNGVIKWLSHIDELQQDKQLSFKTLARERPVQKMFVSGEYLILIEGKAIEIIDSEMKKKSTLKVDLDKKIACVALDGNTLLVGFIGGGCRKYNLKTGVCSVLEKVTEQISVVSLFKGSQEIWWLGTDGQGVLQLQPHYSLFNTIYTDNPVRCFCSYEKNRLLVGTKGSGLKLVDLSTNTLSHFLDESNGLSSMSTYALAKNCLGDIFIGTEGQGIGILYAGKKQVERLEIPSQFPEFHSVYSLCFTNNDSLLWVGTSGYGLIRMGIRNVRGCYKVVGFKQYISSDMTNPLNNDIVYAIASDSSGRYVWFGTRGGGLNRIDLVENKIQSLEDLYNHIQLTNNDVICLLEDEDDIWVGTSYGLNKLQVVGEPSIVQYAEQLTNKTIHGILKDEKGNIWAGTNQGLFCLNLKTKKITEYTYSDGLHNDEFADGAYFRDSENRLFFGGVNGFSYFKADDIYLRDFNPSLVLDGLKIMNTTQDLTSRVKDGVLSLAYDERSFTLTFLTKDFIKNDNCEYAYRFKNHSQEWVYIGNNPNLSFGQLQPGTYQLEVKTTNGDKVWGSNIYNLTIKVGYPWWLSAPALIIYVIVCSIIFYIAKKVIVGRIRLSKQILIARIETAHEQKIYESKLNFFTDVAHELFTPLTLIYTPIQYLLEEKELSGESKKYLNIIKNNAERMRKLIQELIDFRKAGTGNLDIYPELVSIHELILSITDNYTDIMKENKIDFQVNVDSDINLYSDRSFLEKIFFNLLSNTFKYTPRYGFIQIDVKKEEGDQLYFIIRNSGKGLNDKQMSEIFNRYKIFDTPYVGNSVSNGIGLNLTKNLVETLGGTIVVDSVLGKYVEFRVVIPPLSPDCGLVHLNDNVRESKTNWDEHNLSITSCARVLIVEDDTYLRHLLYDILKDKGYVIDEAPNGTVALEKIEQTHPDIILTDIVMEKMDGLVFIHQLKVDPKTSYIPIIVISAMNSVEDQIKACNYGADAFLTKPFHPVQIVSTVENLLSRQKSLKDYFNSSLSSVKVKDGRDLHPDDEKFLDEVTRLVSEHIDEELNPAWIAEYLGMSKASLYRRFKDVLDKTPGEFVRNLRLKQAAKLLRTTQMTVSEIMFRCGFSNKSYFYREFLKQYGYSPKDYRNKANKQDYS